MVRQRTGGVRLRGKVWYAGLRLRSGRWWERPVERPTDGGEYDETYAKLVVAQLSRDYATGAWDPERVAEKPAGNPLVHDFVREWAGQQTYETAPKDRRQIARYLAPAPFAGMHVREVKPRDAAAWVDWLKARRSRHGGVLSGSAVRNAFDVVQRAFDAAVFAEMLPTNPLRLARPMLPAKTDKHREAREGWTFTRSEIAALISSPKITMDWRVRYALLFLTGMRFGESAALRWRDVDLASRPLGRITIARAVKSVSGKEGSTKTGAKKLVPIHPVLARILREWRAAQKPATDDALVVPSARGKSKGEAPNSSAANRSFKQHQAMLGMRPRHQHVARHAFISLAQDDGAAGEVLRWVTHAPPSSAFDGYSRGPWARMCAEVSKLRIKVGTNVGKPRQRKQ